MKSEKTDRTWSFLAASPALNDISFEESVVLLLEDNEENSFGVIINKPIGKTLGEIEAKFEFSLRHYRRKGRRVFGGLPRRKSWRVYGLRRMGKRPAYIGNRAENLVCVEGR